MLCQRGISPALRSISESRSIAFALVAHAKPSMHGSRGRPVVWQHRDRQSASRGHDDGHSAIGQCGLVHLSINNRALNDRQPSPPSYPIVIVLARFTTDLSYFV
jgi:hypothetical protein